MGVLYCSAYPTAGLSHCLVQDKQLELAHAVKYCNFCTHNKVGGMVQYTQRGRFGCVSSGLVNLRDSAVEDNVRKRPNYQ